MSTSTQPITWTQDASNQLKPTKQKFAQASATFAVRNQQTCMIDRYATAPLKWSKSFSDGKNGAIYVYLQDVSPGMLDGDTYHTHLEVNAGCDVSVRTTTYGKIHPSLGNGVQLTQTIRVNDARLSFCPEPIIPYVDARFRTNTTIELSTNAQLFWSESWAPGRVHKGERFAYHSIQSDLTIKRDNHFLVWDPFAFTPSTHDQTINGAWEQFSHCGSIWIIDPLVSMSFWDDLCKHVRLWGGTADGEWPDEKPHINKQLRMAISRLDGPGVSIRILADQAETIQQTIYLVWQYMRKNAWNQPEPPWKPPGE